MPAAFLLIVHLVLAVFSTWRQRQGWQDIKKILDRPWPPGGATRYLFLYPRQGPQSARHLPDIATSLALNPITYLTGAVLFPITALNVINIRANLLDATRIRDEAAVDPYAFTREAYLQQRKYLIHDGNPPTEGYDDIFDEEFGEGDEDVLIIE